LGDFQKIVGNVRAALIRQPNHGLHPNGLASQPAGLPALRQLELISQFGRELERVGGKFSGLIPPSDLCNQLVQLARDLSIHSAALGDGLSMSSNRIAEVLTQARVEVIRTESVSDDNRATLRGRIAACDLGIIEADYAIASTGTFCIVASSRRPSSLTILPPVNFIFVAADRILPSLAEVIAAVGPDRFSSNRVALITGPSRTADIEKMIVIGVHGPKQLYAAALPS
jgi:L-lactate dehydrogenase complex protein LldG